MALTQDEKDRIVQLAVEAEEILARLKSQAQNGQALLVVGGAMALAHKVADLTVAAVGESLD